MKNCTEKLTELKIFYPEWSNKPIRINVMRNIQNSKVFLFDSIKNEVVFPERDEIEIFQDDEELLLITNNQGKCGIFDMMSRCWAYPEHYNSVSLIENKDSVQRSYGKTFMCVLESAGFSGVFTFTKDKDKIVDRSSLFQVDKFTRIETNLFSQKHKTFGKVGRKPNENIENFLFVELQKDKKVGAVVIKNNITKLEDGTIEGGEFETTIVVPTEYSTIRPSEFDGHDGYIDDSQEYLKNFDDVYLYEKNNYHVGSRDGVYSKYKKHICLNDSNIIAMLSRKLLLCSRNGDYGVLCGDQLIVDTKYSPQILFDNAENQDELLDRFTVVDNYGNICEITSKLGAWQKNRKIKVMSMDEYEQEKINEMF